jgi:predicted signal transduction protein with EAL and GGDEF domain
MGIFLFLGATTASLAGVTLIWRATVLDRMWAINALAYRQLAPFGKTVGIPLLLLGATMAVAGTAWFKRRFWGGDWQLPLSQPKSSETW